MIHHPNNICSANYSASTLEDSKRNCCLTRLLTLKNFLIKHFSPLLFFFLVPLKIQTHLERDPVE